MPVRDIGYELAGRGCDDHRDGVGRIDKREGPGALLRCRELRDEREAHGQKRARDGADKDAGDQKDREAGCKGGDDVASTEDEAIGEKQAVSLEASAGERKHRCHDRIGEGKETDELACRGKAHIEVGCQVGLDADDGELGAAEGKTQKNEERQTDTGADRGDGSLDSAGQEMCLTFLVG